MTKVPAKRRIHPILLLLLAGVAMIHAWNFLAPEPRLETRLWGHLKAGTGIERPAPDAPIQGIRGMSDFQGDYSVSIVIPATEEQIQRLQSHLASQSADITFTPTTTERTWTDNDPEAANIERIVIPAGTLMTEIHGPGEFLEHIGFNRSSGQIFYQSMSW